MQHVVEHEEEGCLGSHELFAYSDGAYVLGALSPVERQHFEQHMTRCKRCRRAVNELAGLPGLLARADRDWPRANADVSSVPKVLFPRLRHRQSTRSRRLACILVALAGAAALAHAVANRLLSTYRSAEKPRLHTALANTSAS